MLWVLNETPKVYVKTENIYTFTLKNFVYLNLCLSEVHGQWCWLLSPIPPLLLCVLAEGFHR